MEGLSNASEAQQLTRPSGSGKVKVVAGYALQQKLGSGSFAVVYKGVRLPASAGDVVPSQQEGDANVADTVAVKAITRMSDKLTPKVLQNLEIEIKILRTYRHPNIVCLHDVQKTERHFYLILEYCAGGDVQKLIRSRKAGRLTERLARRLMRDLACGLKFLWGQELIHRDIKPQNLLLTGPLPDDEVEDNPPSASEIAHQQQQDPHGMERSARSQTKFALKLADFGFARHLQTTSLAETLCGSPLYMAPEILQHHRYDAKADLWSVGTVLFEMITGRPPFQGENHIDLLRNIQRKAVRLPPDVKVSRECVNLLRLLLNRNPLSRAGFREFFEACDAFVALGCNGIATAEDEGTCNQSGRQRLADLGTIPEDENGNGNDEGSPQESAEMVTVSMTSPNEQTEGQHSQPVRIVTPQLAPVPSPSIPIESAQHAGIVASTSKPSSRVRHPALTPLVPSPPNMAASPIYTNAVQTASIAPQHHPLQTEASAVSNHASFSRQNSSEENSFVMVEHAPSTLNRSSGAMAVVSSSNPGTPTGSAYQRQQAPQYSSGRYDQLGSSSPGYYVNATGSQHTRTNPLLSTPGDYMVVKPPKGMLSTSPGTGAALMGLLSGLRLTQNESMDHDASVAAKIDSRLRSGTKMLTASEDVGRRAISVAHLGDQRAFAAMRLVMMGESSSSSVLSTTPMEGIEEEQEAEAVDGTVTDDSSSTEIMAARRRRSSSATDKSMVDAKPSDDAEEMPFAMSGAESPPVLSTGIPSREFSSFGRGSSSMTGAGNMKNPQKPTPAMVRAHYNEALLCYLKALKMLQGAIAASQKVTNDLQSLSSTRMNNEQATHAQKMFKRCEGTTDWLKSQFLGVVERADAANSEISKISTLMQSQSDQQGSSEVIPAVTVEEIIFKHALGYGREGTVKQLLGQFESAQSCYRNAGLLAETLLMESEKMGGDERKIVQECVDGFAARIAELDEALLQQSRSVAGTSMSTTSHQILPL